MVICISKSLEISLGILEPMILGWELLAPMAGPALQRHHLWKTVWPRSCHHISRKSSRVWMIMVAAQMDSHTSSEVLQGSLALSCLVCTNLPLIWKSHWITSVVPLTTFINLINDLLSFPKEILAGEAHNYMSLQTQAKRQSGHLSAFPQKGNSDTRWNFRDTLCETMDLLCDAIRSLDKAFILFHRSVELLIIRM